MKCVDCVIRKMKVYKAEELIEGDDAEYIFNNKSYCIFCLLKELQKGGIDDE